MQQSSSFELVSRHQTPRTKESVDKAQHHYHQHQLRSGQVLPKSVNSLMMFRWQELAVEVSTHHPHPRHRRTTEEVAEALEEKAVTIVTVLATMIVSKILMYHVEDN